MVTEATDYELKIIVSQHRVRAAWDAVSGRILTAARAEQAHRAELARTAGNISGAAFDALRSA